MGANLLADRDEWCNGTGQGRLARKPFGGCNGPEDALISPVVLLVSGTIMSSFLVLDHVALATPAGVPLFSGLSLAVGRECVGLVGRNGAGKSTLLRAIAGEVRPTAGTISVAGRVGRLAQTVTPGEETVAQALGIAPALACLARIEAGCGTEADFAQADWTLPQRIEAALAAAGLAALDPQRLLASFSGGERMRIAIAGLLIDPPDLLLLDEPTNNLDAAGRDAIAQLLAQWRGGALVASHDRALLETMDRIVGLSPTGVSVHGGGWSSWVAQRDAERLRADADVVRAERQAQAARRDAQAASERQARRDRAGRSFAASGSAPKILMGRQRERAENTSGRGQGLATARVDAQDATLAAARAHVEVVAPFTLALPPSGLAPGRLVLEFDRVAAEVGGRHLFEGLSFALRGPTRVALAGANGAGKSTVLRLAAGLAAPAAGTIARPVPFALLDQTLSLLDRGQTLAQNMRAHNPALTENAARAALARFAFRNREADRLVGELSGGETLRAGLACVMGAAPVPQLLMLDEPTNHVDIAGLEVIEQGLRGFDGALLVVSHDAPFLAALNIDQTVDVLAKPARPADRARQPDDGEDCR